jgi:hypothetical protein
MWAGCCPIQKDEPRALGKCLAKVEPINGTVSTQPQASCPHMPGEKSGPPLCCSRDKAVSMVHDKLSALKKVIVCLGNRHHSGSGCVTLVKSPHLYVLCFNFKQFFLLHKGCHILDSFLLCTQFLLSIERLLSAFSADAGKHWSPDFNRIGLEMPQGFELKAILWYILLHPVSRMYKCRFIQKYKVYYL